MKALQTEMKEFIETISNEEMQKNPELHNRINALFKSLKGLNQRINKTSNEVLPSSQGVLKYLDKKMLS